jgi:hypothetical protein
MVCGSHRLGLPMKTGQRLIDKILALISRNRHEPYNEYSATKRLSKSDAETPDNFIGLSGEDPSAAMLFSLGFGKINMSAKVADSVSKR